ncbi:MAG TPA: hypothetical protein VKB34_11945 [Povalibacter sp.]|nr:hypothetical protein [Povalibacter sp.]
MAMSTSGKMLGVAALALLAVNLVQLSRSNQQLRHLTQRMEAVEQRAPSLTAASQNQSPVPDAPATPRAQVATQAPATPVQIAQQSEAAPRSAVFEEMTRSGSVDQQSWVTFDERIKTMTPEENKVFWQQMTAAIEHGDIAVYGANQ